MQGRLRQPPTSFWIYNNIMELRVFIYFLFPKSIGAKHPHALSVEKWGIVGSNLRSNI
jgi:hypothetical protein